MNTMEISKIELPVTNIEELDTSKLTKAVKCYINRQARTEHPSGHSDNGGRWYPDGHEACSCCDYIRTPSRGFPYSLMVHCRTITHISALFEVDESLLRKSINAYKKSLKKISVGIEKINQPMNS